MSASFGKRRLKSAGCCLLAAVLLLFVILPPSAGARTRTESLVLSVFDGAKKNRGETGSLLSDKTFLRRAGTTETDWIALAMARFSYVTEAGVRFLYDEAYDVYAGALSEKIAADYAAGGITAATKFTEYQRMSLTLFSLGKPVPEEIDVLVSARAPVKLSRMNILTLSFALLTLTAGKSEGEPHSAGEYIETILSRQQTDGGWSLSAALGAPSDPDVTAMVLTALAPYQREASLARENAAAVKAAVNRALALLSGMQQKNGGYVSYGVPNCESAAQVLVALTSLGIDPASDPRFIKNGCSVVDGLLAYRLPDGAFTHSYQNDAQNPGAVSGKFDAMATDQAAYALVALWRFEQGLNPLFDLSPDRTASVKKETAALRDFLSLLLELLRRFLRMIQRLV